MNDLENDGEIVIYIYDEKGKKLIQEVHTYLDVNETDLFELAVILKNAADDNNIWGAGIESINTDIEVNEEKITKEGWKVGYMERNEPFHEGDSGWSFLAGNENDQYVSDHRNIELISVGTVWQQFDSDIFKYIDMPIGTKLIRISPETFEIDKRDKEIYMIKR